MEGFSQGTGELAPWLSVLAAVSEHQGSNPSNHMAAHNCLLLKFQGIQCPLLTSMDTCAGGL